eukprot:scaffold13607_cov117-Skeletonema_dohrnii-CCMP3373.AAC.10
MDDSTFTSDAASMKHRILLEQLMTVRSLMSKKGTADDDDSRDVIKDIAKKGMTLNEEQLTALSTEFLLTVLLDLFLIRLLDEEGVEGGATVFSTVLSDQQQLVDDAAAAKKKRAAAKKKRYKRNKAAAKQQHEKTKLTSWLSGGIISVIMMVAFSFITTPIVTLSLFQPSDGSGEGKAPPALPPSASKILRQEDIKPNDEASTSPGIIRSPLAAVVPPPIFAPIALSNRRVKSDEMRASTCFDTPNWKDANGAGCDDYEEHDEEGCPAYGNLYEGGMGIAAHHCCFCGGGSHSLPPTNSPTITNSPTKSANPSTAPSISNFPTKSANPSTAPSISNSPTKSAYPSTAPSTAPSMCTDRDWYDYQGNDCVWYEVMDDPGCPEYGDLYKERNPPKGLANENCCYCKNSIVSTPLPNYAPSSSSTSAACIDTPNWKDNNGGRCYDYENELDPGCPNTDWTAGDMGPASKNCCFCKEPSTLDLRRRGNAGLDPFCEEEAETSCCEAADHDVKIVTTQSNKRENYNYTVGLYNECKCDFWLRICEDTRAGEACDYAAEYCCGDYGYGYLDAGDDDYGFEYSNSPTCYCDFFNYAQNEFQHELKLKKLNTSNEITYPCGQFQTDVIELSYGNPRKFERASLEAIYNETNGQNWTNKAGWMNETVDYCQWYGITCNDDEGYVTGIDLRANNLLGQFPVYTRNEFRGYPIRESWWIATKYGLANLYNLRRLDLAKNNLTGTIEYRPLYNLHLLTHFDVSGNQLSGEVDALVSSSLKHVDFSNNKFTSLLSFKKYKQSFQTLRFCDLSNNAIQNDASDLLKNIPPNIEQFLASNNQMHGNLPASLNSLSKLSQFDMSSNALSGSLPGFADSILSLQQLDLSNQTNGFTGSIPKDLWRFQSLKVLNLASNELEGPIPPDIGKMTALEEFDFSNNRLINAIPSELGQLAGSLKHLRLSNNLFTGSIPSEIGQLEGATVLLKLKENNFYNPSKTAPLGLCTLRSVKEFDLANDTQLCPVERNALSDFYYSTKGAEWTDSTNWLDEYTNYCDWKGVTCDDDKQHVTELELANNGLSGRLSESIGDFTLMEVLDLSDNDIKVISVCSMHCISLTFNSFIASSHQTRRHSHSRNLNSQGSIPTEIGQLSELTYLRLSYNAFTGTAPGVLGGLTKLQLLQLQSNRITEMPNMTQLIETAYGNSAFVTDCGVPSAFDETPQCQNCTMCCE